MEKVWNDLSEPHLINKKKYINNLYLYRNYTYIFNHNQLINNQLNTNKINLKKKNILYKYKITGHSSRKACILR